MKLVVVETVSGTRFARWVGHPDDPKGSEVAACETKDMIRKWGAVYIPGMGTYRIAKVFSPDAPDAYAQKHPELIWLDVPFCGPAPGEVIE